MKKIRSQKGMSLTETLVAVLILALLTAAVVVGIGAAFKSYRNSVTISEAQTLASTLTQSLTDELRYAQNIRINDDGVVIFDSATFGPNMTVGGTNRVKIYDASGGSRSFDVLGEKSYTSGLSANATLLYENGVFQLTVFVSSPIYTHGVENKVSVRPLNS